MIIGFASVASAADMPVKAPIAPVAVPYNWTGFYVGVNAGYGWNSGNGASTSNCVDPPANGFCTIYIAGGGFPPISLSPKGPIGGGQIGYNWQFSGIVWGLEADFQGAAIKDSATQTTKPGTLISGTVTQEHKLKWFGTVRGRLGLPVNNWLFYATGGLMYGDVSSTFNLAATNGFVANASSSTTRAGWTVGGGAEFGLNARWTARVEYLYFDLGRDSVTATSAVPGFVGDALTLSQKTAGSIVRGALNYRF